MSLTIGSRSNTNKVEIERAVVETDALTGWVKMDGVGGGNYYQVVDPQALVDALAELFPDVKPSPPKPKVGDRVCFGEVKDHMGTVVHEYPSGRLLVAWDDDPLHGDHPSMFTVIERGEP